MNIIRVFGLVSAALMLVPLTCGKAALKSAPKAACAAISSSGRSGAASLAAKNLNLEIIDPSGHSTTLSAPLQTEGDECRAVFDHKGNLLAVAIRKQFDSTQGLRILIADTEVPEWVANFSVEPQAGLQAPLSLVGFLQDTESLVVQGSGEKTAKATATIVGTIVVDTAGKVLSAAPFKRTLEGRAPSFTDAMHNRLWYLSSPHFCPIRSVTLTGNLMQGPDVASLPNERSYCLPNVVGYPDSDTLVLAATMSDSDAVWRIDLGAGTGERIAAPRDRFPKGDQIDGNGSLSPDGQVFAFARHQFSYGRFDNFSYMGSDIVVVQVRPLRLLGVILPGDDLYQHEFAADHRDGKTSVLVFSSGVWKKLWVEPSKSSEHSAMAPNNGRLPSTPTTH